jgi:hypothetical protein
MGDTVIKFLERERKRAVRVYGEKKVFACLSEKSEYQVLCDIYSELQNDILENKHPDEAKWLKGVVEKTVFSKVMEEHGYTKSGNKIMEVESQD